MTVCSMTSFLESIFKQYFLELKFKMFKLWLLCSIVTWSAVKAQGKLYFSVVLHSFLLYKLVELQM